MTFIFTLYFPILLAYWIICCGTKKKSAYTLIICMYFCMWFGSSFITIVSAFMLPLNLCGSCKFTVHVFLKTSSLFHFFAKTIFKTMQSLHFVQHTKFVVVMIESSNIGLMLMNRWWFSRIQISNEKKNYWNEIKHTVHGIRRMWTACCRYCMLDVLLWVMFQIRFVKGVQSGIGKNWFGWFG